MKPILIPIILLSVPLVGVFIFLFIEVMRSIASYRLFTLHAKLVAKGIYRTKRHHGSFDITSLFVRTRVRENRFRESRIEFDVDGGMNDFFQVNYNQTTGKLEDFNCSESFAKGVNNGNFIALLEQYIPYILEREWGKKSERVMAVEKIQTLGQTFQPKQVTSCKETDKKTKQTFESLCVTGQSTSIQKLVEAINTRARNVETNKKQLEIEEQHDFEMLLQKRLPNLLQHATTHEIEVLSLLEEVLHKLHAWEALLLEEKANHFEREVALIKKITER